MVHFRLFTAGLSQLISTKSIWSAQINKQEIVKASVTHFTVAQEINLWRALKKISCHRHAPLHVVPEPVEDLGRLAKCKSVARKHERQISVKKSL